MFVFTQRVDALACARADLGEPKLRKRTMTDCRLCGGATRHLYNHMILLRYDVRYFECEACGSLQTEAPYWLAEAYGIPGVHIDVGQAARVIQMWVRLNSLLEQISFDPTLNCIDYGGSAGLLTRLMRDCGYNYFSYDLFDNSKYANYFAVKGLDDPKPSLITAFEVFEHFPDPKRSLTEVFDSGVDIVIFSAVFYEAQGRDWSYLVPSCGQHVFFYSSRGLASFAADHGFELRSIRDMFALVRVGSPYFETLRSNTIQPVSPGFAGRLIEATGWGTEATIRDHQYAMRRFSEELTIGTIGS